VVVLCLWESIYQTIEKDQEDDSVDGLFHNALTELVFFEKVTQLRKHTNSSTHNLPSPMINFIFDGFDFVIHC